MVELTNIKFADSEERQFPSSYELRDGIFFPHAGSQKAFTYNDGDNIEEYLLRKISSAEDRSLTSRAILSAIHNWPTLYHLSPTRANLLRPFSFLLRGKILEVGAGCGAITRFLAENGGDIVSVEGSARRARITRTRVSDLNNVSVVCDQIENFNSTQKYDAITVIGVLEYAAIYNEFSSYSDFLRRLNKLLAPNGVIILAIENRLGLKYFAGAREDHTGIPYDGINDSYGSGSVATFGANELERILDQSGFHARAWFYPSPDYKLPSTILSSDALERYPALASSLLAQMAYADPQRPNDPTFSLEQSWEVLGRNGLLAPMANSFLVVASPSEKAIAPYKQQKAVAWHYTVNRHPAFAKETRFIEAAGELLVERTLLETQAPPLTPVRQFLEREPFLPGRNWWNELVAVVNRSDWSVADIAIWARVWIDALIEECGIEVLNGDTFTKHVDGRHFDLTPFNLIRCEAGQTQFFDREWCLKPSIELGYIIVRGIRDSLRRIPSCAPANRNGPYGINKLVVEVLAELGVLIARADIDRYIMLESQVQCWVQGCESTDASTDLRAAWELHLKPRLPAERQKLAREYEILQANIRDLSTQLEDGEEKRHRLNEELKKACENGQAHAKLAGEHGLLSHQLQQSTAELEKHKLTASAALVRAKHAEDKAEQQSIEIVRLEEVVAERFRELAQLSQLLKEKEEAASIPVQSEQPNSERGMSSSPLSIWRKSLRTPKALKSRRRVSSDRKLVEDSDLFDQSWYLESNPDVKAAGVDPVDHYLSYGGREGRAPSKAFDGAAYLRTNPDVALAGINPLVHFLRFGRAEGRQLISVQQGIRA